MRNTELSALNTENRDINPTSLALCRSVDAAELLEGLGVESVEVEAVQDVQDPLVVVVPPDLRKSNDYR